MKKIFLSLLMVLGTQALCAQYGVSVPNRNYYKSSYAPNVNQPTNSLAQQGWEYLETVVTYEYNGQSFVRGMTKLRIFYKNLGNRTVFKATDGVTIFPVQTNPDYQDPNSLASRFEFYVVGMVGNYWFFNI